MKVQHATQNLLGSNPSITRMSSTIRRQPITKQKGKKIRDVNYGILVIGIDN